MIELKNITKSFDHIVLDKINLKLQEGNIYVIKGISGSGKTTLFNILSFLDTNYEGKYYWNNKDVKKMNRDDLQTIKNNISYVFQKSYLFKKLTIKENLLFIKDDIDKIKEYAKKFDVEKLLDKKPEEISGGERQRISLIRALLLDSKLIILDEPTSSLDKENAEIFRDYLKEIINLDKIIVIATHKNIYDEIANCIYEIDFGRLKLVKEEINEKSNNNNDNNTEEQSSFSKYDFLFVRRRKEKRIVLMIVMTLFFLLLFSGISIIQNLKKEAIKDYAKKYPIQVLNIREDDLPYIDYKIEKEYFNYNIVKDDYKAYTLFDANDSYFQKQDLIKYGHFPKTDDEILVNEEFVINKMQLENEEAIGKTIEIDDNVLTISGIICGSNGYVWDNNEIYTDIIDNETETIKSAVFIPYNKIKEIKTAVKDKTIIISMSKNDIIDIYLKSKDGYVKFFNSVLLNHFHTIANKEYTIYNYVKIYLEIGLVFILFMFVFMISKILLELYYNKRQIGYLRLYRVSNDRIHLIFLIDYLMEILLAFIFACIIFNIICLIIKLSIDWNFYISLINWGIIIFISIVYFYGLITIPIMKYLKKDILECITDN